MFIVMIAPECAPAAKVGGLADVVHGLSKELSIRGHAVEIILPKYDCMRHDRILGLTRFYTGLWVPYYDRWVQCDIYFGWVDGLKCFFIDPQSDRNFFSRGVFYGERDDGERFAFFCRAALELMLKTNKHPEIIHCHDWQTGLVPVVYSNFVTTVSPRYAQEIRSTRLGMGLQRVFGAYDQKLGGVLNGIDYGVWNPEVDPHIAKRYGIRSVQDKFVNKESLRHRLWLRQGMKPLVSFVGRLDPQKGVDLILRAVPYCLERGCQFVLLGSSLQGEINTAFWNLKSRFNDYNWQGLESALDRAIGMWNLYPQHFRELMVNGMRYDYSWNHPGQNYLNIYNHIKASR